MFGYRVGFSGTADLMALFSIRINSRWRPPPSWIISNGHISALRGHLCDSTAFLLAIVANNISSCFRDIGQAYWGHEFDLSGSRDVIGHVTI